MQTFITADWHLGEDRFEIMQRPFSSPEEMVDVLISNHNKVVKPEDLVYVNGDVCYQKHPEFLKNVSQFNGHKILLRGNHDRVLTDEDFAPYFEKIIPEGTGLTIEVEGIKCNIVHYPSLAKKQYFNLVGHIHSGWKVQLNSFNVGVDVNHFRPVNMNKILFFYKAVCDFYDQDMWAAYNEANASYNGQRGQQSSYFKS